MNPQTDSYPRSNDAPTSTMGVALAWLFVGIPLAWGVSQTFLKALALFK